MAGGGYRDKNSRRTRPFSAVEGASFPLVCGKLVLFGLRGFVGVLMDSPSFVAFVQLAVGSVLTSAGISLACDKLGHCGFSSKVVLALGVVIAMLGIGLAVHAMEFSEKMAVRTTGLLVLRLYVQLPVRRCAFGGARVVAWSTQSLDAS